MNPLEQYPQARKIAYMVQWIVNLTLGTLGVVMLSIDKNPTWLVVANVAFNYVWTFTGLTASSNVKPGKEV